MSPTTLISMEMVTVLKKKKEKSKDNKGDNFSYTFFFKRYKFIFDEF
jgi:hypothetical protein